MIKIRDFSLGWGQLPEEELQVVRSLHGDAATFGLGAAVVVLGSAVTSWRTGDVWLWGITGVIATLTLVRVLSMVDFDRRDRYNEIDPAFDGFLYSALGILHVFAIGVWTLLVFQLYEDPLSELIAMGTAVGFMVGILGRNFASPATVGWQLTALSVPIGLAFLLRPEPWFLVAGISFAVFVFSVVVNSRRVGRTFLNALETARTNRILAYHDTLTGLPNRTAMYKILSDLCEGLKSGEVAAIYFVDLDHFKRVNDTQGHQFGDRVLIEAARRLSALAAAHDAVVVRHAGDEFLIIQNGPVTRESAADFAAKLIARCAGPDSEGGEVMGINASVGIALAPTDASDINALLQFSDLALYDAKAAGRHTYRFYEPEMLAIAEKRIAMERDLRRAIATGEGLSLAYQPIVEAGTRRVLAFEALLRWQHPDNGHVSPEAFIPIAEETGLMDQLSDWTLNEAFAAATTWSPAIGLAVNLSPSQLARHDLKASIEAMLAKHELSARRVEFELTENFLIDAADTAMANLEAVRALGVRLAIDDFGTGYSNLGYLIDLPFTTLKIDKRFVRGAAEDHRRSRFLRYLLRFVSGMHLDIVVEGVESEADLSFIENLDRRVRLQGFVLARPMPLGAVEGWLEENASKANETAPVSF